jgi:PAS domain S-box-containing protein
MPHPAAPHLEAIASALPGGGRGLVETLVRLKQLADNTSAAVFAKGLDGRYLFANREFARLTQTPVERIVGRTDLELFPPDMADRFRQNDLKVIEERRPIDFEETGGFMGRRRTFLTHKFPVDGVDGAPCAVCGIATDLTERKRTEEALRAAALAVSSTQIDDIFRQLVRHLATILEADAAFIATFSSDDRAFMQSRAAWLDGRFLKNFEYRLEGSPCNAVVGREFRFVAQGVHREFSPDTIFGAKGMDCYAAYPLNDAKGAPLGLIVAMNRTPLHDAHLAEAILKIFAVRAVAEIERDRSVLALRTSEASYRAIFEAAEDAIFVHDFDTGAIVDVNPKAVRTYGWSRDEFLTLPMSAVSSGEPPYTEADAARWLREARQAPVTFEWHRRNRDGSLHWDEVHLRSAEIAGRRRILAFTREITARKLAEQALRASEEQYRSIFNASVDGLAMCDEDGRIVDANAAFLALHGATRDEVVGHPGQRFLPDDLAHHCTDLLAQVLAGTPCQVESTLRERTGRAIDVEIRGVAMRYRDRPHVLVSMADISSRRAAERMRAELEGQLRQAQKMEALGQLTGGIAHDFNNLLTSIVGYIALAAEHPATQGDQRLASYLERAGASCARARDLIRQMLTFSRGRRPEARPLALPPVVQELVNLLRASFPTTIALTTDIDAHVAQAKADPVQIDQVLLNLCINARDAIEGQGQVQVTLRDARRVAGHCASCRKAVDGDYIELAVADTGPGIPEQVAECAFEPFFTTKQPGQGSGMGLATVHGIVHEHGGHVLLDTSPGRGATFRVLLPALAPGEAAAEAPGRADARASASAPLRGRVLVVEDDASVATFMRDLLSTWGLAVNVTASAAEALGAVTADPSAQDLVITDQTMPGMTGLELARALKMRGVELPILLYTGYGDNIRPAELADAGVRAMVHKPVDASALRSLVTAALPR